MGTLYDDDVVAWAEQQAALIRTRQWPLVDVDNIAEEIEDVGKRTCKKFCVCGAGFQLIAFVKRSPNMMAN